MKLVKSFWTQQHAHTHNCNTLFASLQHERTRTDTHIKIKINHFKMCVAQFSNWIEFLLPFSYVYWLSYSQSFCFYFAIQFKLRLPNVAGAKVKSRATVFRLMRSQIQYKIYSRFSQIFYVTKLAANWEHRAESRVAVAVGSARGKIESAATLPKSTKRIGTSNTDKKHPHTLTHYPQRVNLLHFRGFLQKFTRTR